jgi:hypothetical protein
MKTPMTPTLHLNGSSAPHLRDQLCDVAEALRKAMRAIEQAGPNARDYYPQGEYAYPQARAEHDSRLKRIRDVLDEYEQIHDNLMDQVDAARRAR